MGPYGGLSLRGGQQAALPLIGTWNLDTDFHSELLVSLWYDIVCVLCFLLCVFLLYITVLLPVGVIKDDN